MSTLLSVITINYNGLDDTCALISTIPHDDDTEIIVVDNASQADEATEIERRHPGVVVVRSTENLGFAGGNNLGLQASHGKYIFFLNNDTEVPDGHWANVQQLLSRMEADPAIAVVCPKIRFYWDSHPIQFAGFTPLSPVTLRNRSIGFGEDDHGQYDTPHPTPYAHGAAMLVRRDAIDAVGQMPECYFLYYEELDWSMMFRRAGYAIWYDPCMTILHKESRTTGQHSPLKTYYITRNRMLFTRRNTALCQRLLTYCYLIIIVGLRDIIKHTFSHSPQLRRSTVQGITDFIRRRYGQKSFERKE